MYFELIVLIDIIGTIDTQLELQNTLKSKIMESLILEYEYLMNKEINTRIINLGSIIKRVGTGLNPRKNFVLNTTNSSIPYITIKNHSILHDSDLIDNEALCKINKRSKIENDDILFTSLIPIGNTYMVNNYNNDYAINESVFIIKPNKSKMHPMFLYLTLQMNYIKIQALKEASGSIQKSLKLENLLAIKVKVPSNSKIIDNFVDINYPLFQSWQSIEHKVKDLKTLRDFLLPLLLNEQVIIK
jgi:type I restriction enzyme S subunit